MATLSLDVVGYTDVLTAKPEDLITLWVSSEAPEYRAQFVRLLRADDPASAGLPISRDVPSEIDGVWPGERQDIPLGSFAMIDGLAMPEPGFAISCWIWPTLPSGARQSALGLQGANGWNMSLDIAEGALSLHFNDGEQSKSAQLLAELPAREWCAVVIMFENGVVSAECRLREFNPLSPNEGRASMPADLPKGELTVLVGAGSVVRDRDRVWGQRCYNGKVDEPVLYHRSLSAEEAGALRSGQKISEEAVAARWSFYDRAGDTVLVDQTGLGRDGRVLNRPTRLAAGVRFSSRTNIPHDAPEEFSAAHFHDDDLVDAQWRDGRRFRIPAGIPSGCYAVKLTSGDTVDYVPIFVRPASAAAKRRLAVLMPTLSYMVYANSALDESRVAAAIAPLSDPSTCPKEREYVRRHNLRSCYDLHSDGSGVAFCSMLRPMPLFARPNSCSMLTGSPHQMAADLHLIEWLDELEIPYDVLTDHDLHREGVECLSAYRAVISGTHAEYWTAAMLDALDTYQQEGGRFVYLSGNGLYWVTALTDDGTVAEINRHNGTRAWTTAPCEEHISLSGELGGLWRHRGRPPQRLTGIGFASQGFDLGRAFSRTPASYDARVAFAFRGLDDGLIGDHPARVCKYGAAGYEIDHVDPMLGTPRHALVVCSASGFSDSYQRVIEDAQVMAPGNGGQECDAVRADIVFYETPSDGAVFSIGSISYCSALSYDGYRNSASRLLENVIRTFVADGPLPVG